MQQEVSWLLKVYINQLTNVFYSTGLTKIKLVDKIEKENLAYMTVLSAPLLPGGDRVLEYYFGLDMRSQEEQNFEHCLINDKPVTSAMIKSLRPGNDVSASTMEVIMELFKKRDIRVSSAFADVYSGGQNYEPFQQSIFIPVKVSNSISNDTFHDPNVRILLNECFPPGYNISHSNKFFFPYPVYNITDLSIKYWLLLVADIPGQRLHLLGHKPVDEEIQEGMYLDKFRLALNLLLGLEVEWPLIPYLHTCYDLVLDDCDSGLFTIMCIYMLLVSCPIILLQSNLKIYRYNFAYWMMSGSLGY